MQQQHNEYKGHIATLAGSLHAYWHQLSPKLAAISERYSNPVMLKHYEYVSLTLLERTKDQDLALAGYVHGITDMNSLAQLLPPEQKGIFAILEGRRRMMALDPNDPEVSERLLSGFLPHLRDLRSLILLVVEALHHADAEDVMGRFSRSCDDDPMDLPREVPTVPRYDSGITDARFLNAVIAPACEHLGLWRERNLAEDLALFQTDRAQMEEWLEFMREEYVLREKHRRLSLIRSVVSMIAGVEVMWRWHHIASFGRRLGTGSFGSWRHRVSLWSRLVLRCESALQCYEVLGRLSLADEFEKHQRDFSDYLAQPKPTGYQAIRTTVLHRTGDGTSSLLTVEILPRSVDEQRLRILSYANLQRSSDEKLDVKDIQVFSPDGRMYSLPAGSKVLNFTSAVHGGLVARATGAYVNRVLVDLLHPLQSGDIIQIDVGPSLQKELPKGWAENVPVATRRRIRQGHREALRKCLLDLGREQLRRELHKAGIDYAEELNDIALDSYVEECANLIKPAHSGVQNTAGWWLNEFGMFNEKIEPSTWTVDRGLIDHFIKNLVSLLNKSPRVERNTISVPKNQHQTFDDITICDRCRPGPGRKVVGLTDGRNLVLHRAMADCGKSGFDVEWHHMLYREQTFVVEASNRVGISADILACVARHDVDIIDHAGLNLGRTWAVFRFRVQGIGPALVQQLADEIKNVPGVIRIFRPGEILPPILANALPRLEPVRSLLTTLKESPYLSNSQDILDDIYFYGRQQELRELWRALETCRKASHQGLVVFVTGPLKFGKTSLVNRFIREMRMQDPACAIARAQCPFGRGWHETEQALRMNLLEEIRGHADRRDITVPDEVTATLPDLTRFFRQRLNSTVVLFVDEAIRLFAGSADQAQKSALTDFIAWVTNTQGVFLVLAGPKFSERYLEPEYRFILDKTTRIDLKPLDTQDILSLLRCENRGTNNEVGIGATISHANLVTRATGGNPFWTNLIANAAWNAAREKPAFAITNKALREAISKILDEQENAFEDRFFDRAWDAHIIALFRRVLLTLAAGVDKGNGKRTSVGSVAYSALMETCKQNGLVPVARELETVLADLQDRGTIQQPRQPGKERAYEFSASLLREFLTRRLDYAEALWQETKP
jgi:(p)ppGpp synthase/HD superfamily hydrolase/AAA+ ATPase superfamily predicted ATPase